MSVRIIFRRAARAEYDKAADWYEQQRTGLGSALMSAVDQIVVRIGNQPDFYPVVIDDIREAIVTGFPYAIYYRQEPDSVVILAVFHASRDPSIWQRRI